MPLEVQDFAQLLKAHGVRGLHVRDTTFLFLAGDRTVEVHVPPRTWGVIRQSSALAAQFLAPTLWQLQADEDLAS